jgi:flagellar M-ring protein FliF
VVDNKGVLLTNPSDDSVMGLSNNQMEYQRTFEKNLVDKITEILEPVAGHGKIQAKVSAVFDFTRSERTEEKYDPEGVVIRSEQKSTEKTTSGGGTGGVPGTASNLPGGAGAQASSSMGQSQKQDETINYETSKTITRVVESPISLERLTVAIIVDGLLDSQTASVENAEQYTKRTEDDIQYYKNIVKNTIGFTGDRGDEISVTVMPFTKSDAGVIEEAGTDVMQIVYTVLKYLAPVIVAILFFLFLVKPLINMISKMPSAAQSLAVAGRAASAELEGPLRPKEIPVEKQVVEWASQNPGEAAGVVKDWVEEK